MESITCIVETPKGCCAKYNFDPKLNSYLLAKVLPAGLVFPFNFGYLPGTIGEDGDPLDVIIISEAPAFQVAQCGAGSLAASKRCSRSEMETRCVTIGTSRSRKPPACTGISVS